jgi:hypothetical protein
MISVARVGARVVRGSRVPRFQRGIAVGQAVPVRMGYTAGEVRNLSGLRRMLFGDRRGARPTRYSIPTIFQLLVRDLLT